MKNILNKRKVSADEERTQKRQVRTENSSMQTLMLAR